MKFLPILLALCFFSFAPITQETHPDGTDRGCAVTLMDVNINWSDDCSSFTWSAIICNNNKNCTTPGGELNMTVEYCPFTFDFTCHLYGALPPQTCTMITGTGNGACGFACVVAELGTQSITECEGC